MANHESSRTTGLYDRRGDEITFDEVERVGDLKVPEKTVKSAMCQCHQ